MNKGLVSPNTMQSPDFQNWKSPIRFEIHLCTIEEAVKIVNLSQLLTLYGFHGLGIVLSDTRPLFIGSGEQD